MKRYHSVQAFQQDKDRQKSNVTRGFVPTMGALHQGHLSLIKRSLQTCDETGVSIFVNPTQFGPNEDLESYPRTLESDLEKLTALGVDWVFFPNQNEIYPLGLSQSTQICVPNVSEGLCAVTRPRFFKGVAQVVLKLLNAVQPQRAFFGEKDYQQCVVVETLVKDLLLPIEIVRVPIVRAPNGLAMSSRNQYLSKIEKNKASILYQTLLFGNQLFQNGELDSDILVSEMKKQLVQKWPEFELDYLVIVDPVTLKGRAQVRPEDRLLVAGFFNGTRLIDNIMLDNGSYSVRHLS